MGAYNEANLREPLPHIAGRLLIAMFPEDDVCQRSQFDLAGEGFSKNSLPSALRRLGQPDRRLTECMLCDLVFRQSRSDSAVRAAAIGTDKGRRVSR